MNRSPRASLILGKVRELVKRPANLVGTGSLKDLGFETDVETGLFTQQSRCQKRGVIDVGGYSGFAS